MSIATRLPRWGPRLSPLFYVATCREDMRRLIELRRQGGAYQSGDKSPHSK